MLAKINFGAAGKLTRCASIVQQQLSAKFKNRLSLARIVAAPAAVQIVRHRSDIRQIHFGELRRRRFYYRVRRADIERFVAGKIRFESESAGAGRVTHVDVAPERAGAADERALAALSKQLAV